MKTLEARYQDDRKSSCKTFQTSSTAAGGEMKPNLWPNGNGNINDRHHYYQQDNVYRKNSDDNMEQLDDTVSELYRSIMPQFELLNLVPSYVNRSSSEWRIVGNVSNERAIVNTIQYMGSDHMPQYDLYESQKEQRAHQRPVINMANTGKHRFRVVTNIAPPFVIESTKLDNNTCLTGEFCLKVISYTNTILNTDKVE